MNISPFVNFKKYDQNSTFNTVDYIQQFQVKLLSSTFMWTGTVHFQKLKFGEYFLTANLR